MAYVNYIIERESFARHARDNGYTGNEQLLWYALFTIFNERASRNAHVWPDGFIRISNKELLSWLPFTENTLIQIRGEMVNPAKHNPPLVEYLKGKRNADMPQYKMRWFSVAPENDLGYLNARGNMGGNIGGSFGGNTGGNPRGNMGDINVNINQVQTQTVTQSVKKIYYNDAWRTDARAARAVAQNILAEIGAEGSDAPFANDAICYYFRLGLTPDQALTALDGCQKTQYIPAFLHTEAARLGLEGDVD